jgi:hypothetical protein
MREAARNSLLLIRGGDTGTSRQVLMELKDYGIADIEDDVGYWEV